MNQSTNTKVGRAGTRPTSTQTLEGATAMTSVQHNSDTDTLLSMMATLDSFEAIVFRAIRDALLEAMPEYWEKRARDFDAVGTADGNATAYACRCHAWLLRTNKDMTIDVDGTLVDVLREDVAA